MELVNEEKALSDFNPDNLPGTGAVLLLCQILTDALEVPLHSQSGILTSQVCLILLLFLPQTCLQVIQLLMKSNEESVQQGVIPGRKRATCTEEVEDLLDHLMQESGGMHLVQLVPIHEFLRKLEVGPVLQT